MTAGRGRVILIGAGPGDPGLITVRGVRLLGEADVVVYDRGVEGALRWARPDAERLEVGAPAEREMAQEAISMLVADKARDGLVVARLKWGDPFVFDSGAKEAIFLHEHGIPFEVVPGIPAAVGATAYAGVPLTYPGGGETVVLLRGHERETDSMPAADWDALATLDGTLVCYVNGRQAATVVGALLDHGAAPDQPAALIHYGTTTRQHTETATLAQWQQKLEAEAGAGAGLLVVGRVAGLRDHLRWFDERPLFGRRIVVTRSRDQAVELVERLEHLGAQTIEAPVVKVVAAEDPEAIDRAIALLDQCDWVVFESATSVGRFLSALMRGPRDLRALGAARICAIGPSTADRLAAIGIKPDVTMPEFGSESLGDAMAAKGDLTGRRVLVVRPDHMRDTVARALEQRGSVVTDLVAYRTVMESPDSQSAQALYRQLLDGQIDAVTFTGPGAVRNLTTLIGEEQAPDLLNTTVVAAIGPVTAAAAGALGIKTTVVAETFTVDGLVSALVNHFSGSAPGLTPVRP